MLVRLLAHEVAVGEQQLAELTLVKEVTELVIGDRKSHAVSLIDNGLGR